MENNTIQTLANGLLESIQKERNGELSQNGGRLAKGKYLTLIERETIRMRSGGEELLATPLQASINMVKETLEKKGIFDINLSNEEVSIVRKAFVKIAEPLGGIDSKFTDYFAINPNTGMKIVNENKQPFTRELSEIALNKLYLISDWAEHDFDAALSFAKRVSERSLKKVNKVWRVRKDANVVFGIINSLIETTQVTEQDINLLVAEEIGEEMAANPTYKNIQVLTELYDGAYTRTRNIASLILGFLGHNNVLDKQTGTMLSGFFMEQILNIFDPQDHYSYAPILELLTMTGEITTEEAANFVVAWNEDGLSERWEELNGAPAPKDSAPVENNEEE